MIDNEKRAHDIASALLSKSLEHTSSELFIFDELGYGKINSHEIVDAYLELYTDILNELNSRQ